DLTILSIALWGACFLRFDWHIPTPFLVRLMLAWPYIVALQYGALAAFGVPRFAWSYVGLREVVRVLLGLACAFVALLAARLGAPAVAKVYPAVELALLPIGVLIIDLIIAFLAVTGARVLKRLQREERNSQIRAAVIGEPVRTLLVGAGEAGLLVAKEIAARPDLQILPVGFIDDNPHKVGTVVHGIRVLGTTAAIQELARRFGAEQVLITIANAPARELRRVQASCNAAGLKAKVLPGLFEIVGGRVNLSRFREVTIEDLLRREPVALRMDEISRTLQGKVVLVSGAGGSIGSELCRQICRFKPERLILLEQAENSLFHVHRELVSAFPELKSALVPCIADICNEDRVDAIMATHRPDIVFHAAAHKHVPMMEWNPGEAVRNNVLGTRTLADACHAWEVQQFVMISTDKAVNPTSVMGATKRVAEMYIQTLGMRSSTRFSTVRFGNVLGSAGSVIPLFKEQIAKGGPVLVTHPEMKRYFMTIPEACQLVLQAGAMGRGGEIFILDMGEPVKIVDLARDLITLSGLTPGEDIEIKFTGIRPGEKLFEELSVAEESVDKTRHPKIFVGRVRPNRWEDVVHGLAILEATMNAADPAVVRVQLQQLIPEYEPVVLDSLPQPATLHLPPTPPVDEGILFPRPQMAV
ncbi:MAG: polysaccharide biosynthesis protein, partial [Myxococcaceae bacterium]|nr:polysaccharide biosynthesis protein [Myxococcaceae bacterium]